MESRTRSDDRVSIRQQSILLEYMEEHRVVARCSTNLGPASKHTINELWEEVAGRLNACGCGSTKTTEAWRKNFRNKRIPEILSFRIFKRLPCTEFCMETFKRCCLNLIGRKDWNEVVISAYWIRWKNRVKSKAADIDSLRRKTGGGPYVAPTLTEMEERILTIIGRKAAIGDQCLKQKIQKTDATSSSSTWTAPLSLSYCSPPHIPQASPQPVPQEQVTPQSEGMEQTQLQEDALLPRRSIPQEPPQRDTPTPQRGKQHKPPQKDTLPQRGMQTHRRHTMESSLVALEEKRLALEEGRAANKAAHTVALQKIATAMTNFAASHSEIATALIAIARTYDTSEERRAVNESQVINVIENVSSAVDAIAEAMANMNL